MLLKCHKSGDFAKRSKKNVAGKSQISGEGESLIFANEEETILHEVCILGYFFVDIHSNILKAELVFSKCLKVR